VVGPNGAGKSSLIRAALALERVKSGDVCLDGVHVTSLGARERAARIGWLAQSSPIEEGLLVLESVAAARFRFRETRAASMEVARASLAEVDAHGLESVRLDRLSGGELQRVRLAALVAQEAELWLLDEPGNHLDPSLQLALCAILVKQVQQGRGVLVVTHDLAVLPFLRHSTTRVVAMREGAIVFEESLDSPRLAERLSDLYSVVVHRVDVGGMPRFVLGGTAS
jgi:iron complex transport system ATP-binding protein